MQTLPEGDPEPFMDRVRIYTLRTAEALEHHATHALASHIHTLAAACAEESCRLPVRRRASAPGCPSGVPVNPLTIF